MKRLFEKWYVLFMLLRIAHHNKVRMKFEKKYDDVFYGYGQDLEHITLEKHMGMQRPSGIPVSNIMEVIFGNLSVLYVVKDLKQKLEM